MLIIHNYLFLLLFLRCVYGYETVIIIRHIIKDKTHNLDQQLFFRYFLPFFFLCCMKREKNHTELFSFQSEKKIIKIKL